MLPPRGRPLSLARAHSAPRPAPRPPLTADGSPGGAPAVRQLELDSRLSLSRRIIPDFVRLVARRMPANPYHSWAHAADVTQAVYALGLLSGALGAMPDGERLALLVAALCHDIEHPVPRGPRGAHCTQLRENKRAESGAFHAGFSSRGAPPRHTPASS